MGIREWLQQYGIHKTENRRRCPDAQSERCNGDDREPRIAPQVAKSVADVSAQLIEDAKADGSPVCFILRGRLSEVDAGFAAGLFFGQAPAD